jgi:DNA topoisomerase-2
MKSIENKFRKLSEVEHVLLRPGRYIGSISPHTSVEYTPTAKGMEKREMTYNPGFLKLFDEVISNSVDHSKRPEGKGLDTIKVNIDFESGEISVQDNGGIPVVKHKEYDQYVPEMIFELRSGSNFDDDDQSMLTGQNGEGAALTNIFSTRFVVETCDGKYKFKMVFEDNSQTRNTPVVRPAAVPGTTITYNSDWAKLGMKGIDDDNVAALIGRVYQVAACNPHLKVYLNGTRIAFKSFKDYIEMFTDEYVYDDTAHWKIGIAASEEGFTHISFVNGTHTKTGGTHIDYVANQICAELRAFIKKKHKIDIKPSELKQHFRLFIDAQMVNPRYSSQTKDDLITETKDYKTSWTANDKFINKILKSSIVQNVLDWAEAKARQEELKELRKLNKASDKANLKHIEKFNDATEKNRSLCSLFLAEGDSAAGPIRGARNPKIHGVYALRGRPVNVSAAPLAQVKENKQFEAARTIVGLKYGEEADVPHLNFNRVIVASDADQFGHSIAGLIVNMYYRLWPNLIEEGLLYRLVTPVVSVQYKKDDLEFFTMEEFEAWRDKHDNEKYSYKFLKGLGSSSPKQWKKYMDNLDNYLIQFTLDKAAKETLDLCFLKEAGFTDKRKVWLDLE